MIQDIDFDRITERYRAWWENEMLDRVCLSVTAPKEEQCPLPTPVSAEQLLTDPDYIVRQWNAQISNTYYGGDALPIVHAPGSLLYASYGGQAKCASDTVWVDPTILRVEEWEGYCFDIERRRMKSILCCVKCVARVFTFARDARRSLKAGNCWNG